eukprot:178030-Chlamydomonas_euryale.AAC.7
MQHIWQLFSWWGQNANEAVHTGCHKVGALIGNWGEVLKPLHFVGMVDLPGEWCGVCTSRQCVLHKHSRRNLKDVSYRTLIEQQCMHTNSTAANISSWQTLCQRCTHVHESRAF